MIIVFSGTLGAGKTLTMTAFGKEFYHDLGRPCVSNYPTSFARRISSWAELVEFRDGCCLLDEFYIDVDSRSFSENVEQTSWFLQTRKDGLDLMMTSQSMSQLDKRIRECVDILCQCTKRSDAFGRPSSHIDVIDFQNVRLLKAFDLIHGQPLYDLYDTKAKVFPLEKLSRSRR